MDPAADRTPDRTDDRGEPVGPGDPEGFDPSDRRHVLDVATNGLGAVNYACPDGAKVQAGEVVLTVRVAKSSWIASMRPGNDAIKGGHWQFSSPEVLTAYTDLQKATADIRFLRTQRDRITELALRGLINPLLAAARKAVAR